jgi:hypothetical protein
MKLITHLFKKKSPPIFPVYFTVFEQLYLLTPEIYYWIQKFPNKSGRYILSQFKHQDFVKYNGLELVIIDKSLMTYHRLPGAKPNGTGKVEPGQHQFSLNSMNDTTPHHFTINKPFHPYIQISSVTSETKPSHLHLPRRTLDYDRFVPELIEIILSGLDLHYRNLLNSKNQTSTEFKNFITSIKDKDIDPRITMLSKLIHELA